MLNLRYSRPRLEKHQKACCLDNLKASTLDSGQNDDSGLALDLEIASNVEGLGHHLNNRIVKRPIGREPKQGARLHAIQLTSVHQVLVEHER
ncbi:hypothetical protein ACRS9F_30500 [Pseudomonas aeruginosa]|uniref:hypothetical protein n=1 Tax=Pseudomonas aeruginosa TaxID=287 RepID=UPI003EE1942B